MWIHLLRHGIAIDHDDPDCPDDPERYLTEKGRRRAEVAAKGMSTLGLEIDGLIVSPYVRALQTAQIAVDVLGLADLPRVEDAALVPMGAPGRVCEVVRDSGFAAPLLVGHAPNLDLAAAYFAGAERPVTALKKSGLATVELLEPSFGRGRLYAIYPPAMLRWLAGER